MTPEVCGTGLTMPTAAVLRATVLALAALGVMAGCTGAQPTTGTVGPTATAVAEEVSAGGDASAPPPQVGSAGVLTVTRETDGDSFVASDGVEYRVGMVNTPERSECGASEASRRTYELLDEGFRTLPYATDPYGRSVARVRTVAGDDLGVTLAQEGLADDTYLEQFRHEQPDYADELDVAFAEARQRQAGLWRSCWADDAAAGTDVVPVQPLAPTAAAQHSGRVGVWECHPAYVECLPQGPDLDCRDVGHAVMLTGTQDPYRLDGNSTTRSDGVGCDSYDRWTADLTYPYYR